ncbi:hypothetical protein PWT90_06219 [Aphanocladium album]|nr:hypothetical protein PWT90_06219 [Aphanocladium album]
MTTTHLLPEKVSNPANMNSQGPPTYAESIASEASHIKPSLSRQPSSASQRDRTSEPMAQQFLSSDRKQPISFSKHFRSVSSKFGRPLNKAANAIGAEGWWPTSMEKECNKAARILHSFTSLQTPSLPTESAPMHPLGISRKSMVKIPDAVLAQAAGLAIFNVLRAGTFHGSLAAGSGLVVARLPDGSWSAPSSFLVSTVGVGFTVGLDVYDCVCVLNTPAQVAAFSHPRVSLGGAASIAVGPLGTGASLDAAFSRTGRPMWSYMKSRGLWAGVQIDGTVFLTRADANAAFYGEKTSAGRILGGEMAWPEGKGTPLREVLRAVDGRQDLDRGVMQEVVNQPTPGDAVYANEKAAVEVATQEAEHESAEEEKARLAKSGY